MMRIEDIIFGLIGSAVFLILVFIAMILGILSYAFLYDIVHLQQNKQMETHATGLLKTQ